MGKAYVLNNEALQISKGKIQDINLEIEKFSSAIEKAKIEITKIREVTLEKMGSEKAQIFDAHLLLAEDPEIKKQVINKIETEKVNCSWALKEVTDQFINLFNSMEDEYMKERASDIKDVFTRVQFHIAGIQSNDLSLLDKDVIIVAHDLTPSQTAVMNKNHVLGFITEIGGKTSHSAIMARTMEIPAVVGLGEISDKVKNEDFILFDGSSGQVYINPTQEIINEFNQKKKKEAEVKAKLDSLVGQESITLDGHKVEIAGNIGTYNDLDSFEKNDAESVGLYRTEFLFMDRSSMPSEQEQYEAYSKIIKRLNGKRCIIRTLDIGGDKKLDYLDIGEEENPFLGYRAIRVCLKDKDLFKAQLRALLRASVHGPIGIMFPMISSLEELLEAKAVLEECKTELSKENQQYNHEILVGMMIEIPAAAVMTDVLANHVNFFSIGTNDLTQYTCAVDRMNEKIEKLYDPFHPGLLRLIHMTIKNANEKNIMPAMCGSMAHIKELVPLFLGMGLHEFSMSPLHVLPTRELIRALNYQDCKGLVEKIMTCGSAHEVKNTLQNFLKSKNLQ
jgi:phosphotransferase system enzyme I (PtsI)